MWCQAKPNRSPIARPRRARKSQWWVNAIAREGIFHVRFDAIAMTNRNVTSTRKLLSRSPTAINNDTSGVPVAGKTAVESFSPDENRRRGWWMKIDVMYATLHASSSIFRYHSLFSSPFSLPPSRNVVTPHILLLRLNILQHVWRFQREEKRVRCLLHLKIHRYFPRYRCSRNDYPSLWINSRYIHRDTHQVGVKSVTKFYIIFKIIKYNIRYDSS